MKLAIGRHPVQERYPEVVPALVEALRSSTSRERERPAEDIQLHLEWAVSIGDGAPRSISSILSAPPGPPPGPYGDVSPGDITRSMVRDVMSPRISWGVTGTVGRWHRFVRPEDRGVPDEIIEAMHASAVEAQTRRLAAIAMTPEERGTATRDAIGSLAGGRGFLVIGGVLPPRR